MLYFIPHEQKPMSTIVGPGRKASPVGGVSLMPIEADS